MVRNIVFLLLIFISFLKAETNQQLLDFLSTNSCTVTNTVGNSRESNSNYCDTSYSRPTSIWSTSSSWYKAKTYYKYQESTDYPGSMECRIITPTTSYTNCVPSTEPTLLCNGNSVIFVNEIPYSCDENTKTITELPYIENGTYNPDGTLSCNSGYIVSGSQCVLDETPDNSYCGSQQNALNILNSICSTGVNSSTINPDQNGCYNSLTYSCDNGEIGTVEITQDFITGTGDGGGTSTTDPTDPDTSTGTGGTTTDPTNPDTDTGTSTGGTTTDPIDPTSPDSGDSTDGTDTASGGTTGGGSTGETDVEGPNVIFPDDDFVPDPVDTLPEGNTTSNCDETQLTLTEMLLCEMNENLQDSDGTFPNAVDDLKNSNNEAYKAMNNNIIGSNKRLDEIIDLERNNLQAQNISNGLISDVKDLLTPPADNGQSELDKLDTILDDETNFSEDIELTSDLQNTANGYFENYSNIFKNQLLALFSTFFSINTTGTQALGVPYNFTLAGRNFTGVFLDEQMFIELHMDKLAKIIIFGFSILGFLHAFRFVIASKDN